MDRNILRLALFELLHELLAGERPFADLPEAIAKGADFVVVGRPILEASDPTAAVAALVAGAGTAVQMLAPPPAAGAQEAPPARDFIGHCIGNNCRKCPK